MGQTGIEVLRDVIAGKVKPPPMYSAFGFELVEVTDGFARYALLPGEQLYGWHSAVHSGVAATLLDAAMSSAVLSVLDSQTSHSTAGLNAHLTRAITARSGKLVAEGWVVHRGSRLVTAEGRLSDDQGKLLAHGSGTYALSERPSPGSGG